MPTPETAPGRRADAPWTPAEMGGIVGAILFVLVSLWLVATTSPPCQAHAAAHHTTARPAAGGASQ